MENYRVGVDEGNDVDSIDFDALVRNLEVLNCISFVYCDSNIVKYLIGLIHVKTLSEILQNSHRGL